jgi:hypothetical protein
MTFLNYFLLFFLLIGINFSNAQEAKLITGPKLESSTKVAGLNINNEHTFVFTTGHSSDDFMQSWQLSTSTMAPVGSSKIISSPKNKQVTSSINSDEYEYLKKIDLENKTLLFFTKYDSKTNNNTLYCKEFDKSFEPLSDLKEVEAEIFENEKTGKKTIEYNRKAFIDFRINKKKDKVLIIVQREYGLKNLLSTPGSILLCLYNANEMQELNSVEYDFGVFSYASTAILGDNGYVYSLMKISPSDDSQVKALKNQGEGSWYFKLVGINMMKKNDLFDHDIHFKGRKILYANLEYSTSGELICAGTYSDLEKYDMIEFDGLFCAKFDPLTGASIYEGHKRIDRSIVQFMNSSSKIADNDGTHSFIVNSVVSMENGTQNLILEGRNFNGIIVANIAKDGEISWMKLIPKKQDSEVSEYKSFTYFKYQNSLKFLFNDNSKNYDPMNGKFLEDKIKYFDDVKPSESNKCIALVEMDENGNTQQKMLFKLDDFNLRIRNAVWAKSGKEIITISHFKDKVNGGVYLSRFTF